MSTRRANQYGEYCIWELHCEVHNGFFCVKCENALEPKAAWYLYLHYSLTNKIVACKKCQEKTPNECETKDNDLYKYKVAYEEAQNNALQYKKNLEKEAKENRKNKSEIERLKAIITERDEQVTKMSEEIIILKEIEKIDEGKNKKNEPKTSKEGKHTLERKSGKTKDRKHTLGEKPENQTKSEDGIEPVSDSENENGD